jgi:hypothetical protein
MANQLANFFYLIRSVFLYSPHHLRHVWIVVMTWVRPFRWKFVSFNLQRRFRFVFIKFITAFFIVWFSWFKIIIGIIFWATAFLRVGLLWFELAVRCIFWCCYFRFGVILRELRAMISSMSDRGQLLVSQWPWYLQCLDLRNREMEMFAVRKRILGFWLKLSWKDCNFIRAYRGANLQVGHVYSEAHKLLVDCMILK